jgi:hypothetical protein
MEEKSSTSVASLIVRGAGHVRLPHRYLLDFYVVIVELPAKLGIEVPGDMLRRGGDLQERRELVEILVIEGLEKLLGLFLEDLEIDAEPGFVQFAGIDGDLNLPVVAMKVFTVPLVVDKIVGRSEGGRDGKAIHGKSFSSDIHLPARTAQGTYGGSAVRTENRMTGYVRDTS